jgi:hypothetical protein
MFTPCNFSNGRVRKPSRTDKFRYTATATILGWAYSEPDPRLPCHRGSAVGHGKDEDFTNPTTTSVTLSPATVTAGTRVVYLVVMTPKPGTGTPTGTISFTTGSTLLCTAVLSGGVAACGATNAPAGTDKVTGTYSGGNGSSSGTATLTVKAA